MTNIRCTAHNRAGQPCKAWAIKGGKVCKAHGVNRHVRAKAKERLKDQAALDLAVKQGIVVPNRVPVHEVALTTLQRCHEFETKAAELLAKLDDAEWRYEHPKAGEQLRGEVQIFVQAVKQTGNVATQLMKLDLDAKARAFDQAQAMALVNLITSVLVRLGLDPRDEEVQAIVPDEMRKLGSGA